MPPDGLAPLSVGVLVEGGVGGSVDGAMGHIAEAAGAGRLDRPVEFVVESVDGLPRGSAASVEAGFWRLAERGVLTILGPAITDNGLIVRDLADRAQIPCLNWTGSDRTRSEWMFHYQIGSLEEEPFLLVAHLMASGVRRVAVVEDRSPIGHRYGEYLAMAAEREGLEVGQRIVVSPVTEDLGTVVGRLRAADPDAVVYLGLGLSARALGVAIAESGWRPTVVTNSALMFGYAQPDWRAAWEGWTYVDAWSEDNPLLTMLRERAGEPADGIGGSGMGLAAGYDLGRLVVEALAGAEPLTRTGVKEAFERVKCLPAALGTAGTTMSFGQWDRAALKGGFLVLRRWQGGQSVRVTD